MQLEKERKKYSCRNNSLQLSIYGPLKKYLPGFTTSRSRHNQIKVNEAFDLIFVFQLACLRISMSFTYRKGIPSESIEN